MLDSLGGKAMGEVISVPDWRVACPHGTPASVRQYQFQGKRGEKVGASISPALIAVARVSSTRRREAEGKVMAYSVTGICDGVFMTTCISHLH